MQQPGYSAGKVLVADDLAENADLLHRLLLTDGYDVCIARDGDEALDLVAREQPDIVLLDVMMPGKSGFDVCRRIKQSPATRFIPVVLVTALRDIEPRLEGIHAGADDFLTKPFNAQELKARVGSLVRLKRCIDELESADSTLLSLALTIEARDPTTDGHCQRLARYATALGRSFGLPEPAIAALYRGGFLHDLGKVGVPDAVLLKKGPLTREEREVMKQHTIIGDRLCGHLRSLRDVRPIVRSHHERLDGSGYPDGLSGDQVPLLAQIIAVVDVYDALTGERPYRAPDSPEEACAQLLREARRGWWRLDLVEELRVLVIDGRLDREPQVDLRAAMVPPR
ncbi:MAG TPA: HD domain-containing phosphohydrolase [Vicinamibacterales bacterium]|nr:HD domain-containing phosphohydrolase [Vicinamibacterales bacterium]